MVRHIVLFAYKEIARLDDIKELHRRFTALPGLIKEIEAFEWGINISPENLNEGYTDAYVLTFGNLQRRDSYLIHPDHQAFSAFAGPLLEKVLVFDYETEGTF